MRRRERPLSPHPNRLVIVMESATAVAGLAFAVTVAVLGAWWVWWVIPLVYSAGSAAAAWVHWRSGR
jgi:hypothetical protein